MCLDRVCYNKCMEELKISIDLKNDLKLFLKDKFHEDNLNKLGVSAPQTELNKVQSESVENLVELYSKLRHRLLIGHKRKVVIHNSLIKNAKYQQYRSSITKLKNIFENGSSIRPYLSNKVDKIYFDDRLLLDWNIHHLHFIPNSSKQRRANDILFITESEDIIHFLSIMTHEDFYNIDLLKYIYENAPSILEHYKLVGIQPLPQNYSSETIKNLRDNNVGYCVSFGDNVYAPSLNKRSITYLKEAMLRLSVVLKEVEKSVIEQREYIFSQIPQTTNALNLEWIIEKGNYKLQLYDRTTKGMCLFDCRNAPNPIKILEQLNIL